MPDSNVPMNVDGYIYRTLSPDNKVKKFRNENLYQDGVDTDGYNCISNRDKAFKNLPNDVFKETDVNICDYIPILNKYKGKTLNKRIKDKFQ